MPQKLKRKKAVQLSLILHGLIESPFELVHLTEGVRANVRKRMWRQWSAFNDPHLFSEDITTSDAIHSGASI